MNTTSSSGPVRDEHHLFVKFSALALPVNEPCELFFFVYDGRVSKVLRSVEVCVCWCECTHGSVYVCILKHKDSSNCSIVPFFMHIIQIHYCNVSSERYFISLSQHCLPKDPEKINQCFALFTVSFDLCIVCQSVQTGLELCVCVCVCV